MENSAFVPNPIPPPALVVFSQAGGLPEALRMQRPFNPQETKDLHVPFATAGFGIRHVDGYPGLPAHLLHHLQPRFLHPALDPHTPFGSGAFRPLGPAASDAKGFPSAFAPPSKCPEIDSSAGRHDSSPRRQPPRQQPGPPAAHLSSIFTPSTISGPEERAFNEGQQVSLQSRRSRAGSVSPGGASPQLPAVKEESMEAQDEREAATGSPNSEGTERSTPEEGRGFRLGPLFGPGAGRCGGPEPLGGLGALGLGLGFGPAYRLAAAAAASPVAAAAFAKGQRCLLFDQGKKKFQADPSCCPACGITLRPGELESHYIQEVERLYKLTSVRRGRREVSRGSLPPPPPTPPTSNRRDSLSSSEATPEGRWETYQRIKANRQGRLRIKNRKRKPDETTCPVCNERVHGSLEELNAHVEQCLRKHGSNIDEEENVDVEGDSEMFVEYEWAGQRRIRASTLLVGGYAGAGIATTSSSTSRAGEDEEDLVVDGDDTATFGPAQFSEADVVMPSVDGGSREEKERHALREAVISPGGTTNCTNPCDGENQIGMTDAAEEGATEEDGMPSEPNELLHKPSSSEEESGSPLVEALKHRIRELEGESRSISIKCLICMDVYKNPVISICCWHVHCEECWLHTLGAKKLCPQCNMITSPSDLRRIYL